ncbi:MAG TPA: hypothetical protein DDX85_03310 [Nitrospiraceae bacterium]|nr:hypothetical protein [Nitrospiraceae bacterium]
MKLAELRVVALGGGSGLPAVLRSLKDRLFPFPSCSLNDKSRERLTAIVTVTDDGGSSGRLRHDFDMLPPGDIRNCLSAMADNSHMMYDLFQYRFDKGNGLNGHSLGNLVLTAITHMRGNFLDAVSYCSDIMNVKGRALPSTTERVVLGAKFRDGLAIRGETCIAGHRGRIQHVYLIPSHPAPLPQTIEAIEKADAIIIGPGSLYTSIIPNLLVRDIAAAIRRSTAKKIYVCNLMTEPGETDGYTATDHVKAIFDHTEYGFFQYVLVNNGQFSDASCKFYVDKKYYPVQYDIDELRDFGLTSIAVDLVSERKDKVRHDEEKLGKILTELL